MSTQVSNKAILLSQKAIGKHKYSLYVNEFEYKKPNELGKMEDSIKYCYIIMQNDKPYYGFCDVNLQDDINLEELVNGLQSV